MVGIGNALVDVIAHADDAFIGQHELVKGSMTLVDTDRALYLYQALGGAIEMSGGSAANTMCGVASFGGTAAYIGKVSDDELGRVFGHDCRAVGVQFRPGAPADGTPTGRCIIVVTPDAQRTMNTYLGVSSLLAPERHRCRHGCGRRGAVHGGLPLRPAGGEGSVPLRRARSLTPTIVWSR